MASVDKHIRQRFNGSKMAANVAIVCLLLLRWRIQEFWNVLTSSVSAVWKVTIVGTASSSVPFAGMQCLLHVQH